MAIGERIRFLRNLRGFTQKQLGLLVGFPEKNADVRLAQYESGVRTPKADLTNNLAAALEVSPLALNVPDVDTYFGLMHTLFVLEDRYGLTIEKHEGNPYFRFDFRQGSRAAEMADLVRPWAEMAEKYRNGEITKEEYDRWRYNYPQFDGAYHWVQLPSQELSDALVKKSKKWLKNR